MAEQKFPLDDGKGRAFTKAESTSDEKETTQEALKPEQPEEKQQETEEAETQEKDKAKAKETEQVQKEPELSEEEKCTKCRNDTLIVVGVFGLLFCTAMIVLGGYIIVQVNAYYNPVTNLVLYILTNVAIGLLVIGSLGVITIIIGMTIPQCPTLGSCLAFVTMVGALLIASIVLLIYYGTQATALFTQAQESLLENLAVFFTDYTENGQGGTSSSVNTYAYYWNQVMFQLSCCGSTSSSDYSKATLWSKTYTISGVSYTAQVPTWCCVMNSGTSFAVPQLSDSNCPVSPTTSNSYMSVGCFTALTNAIQATTLSILAIVAAAVTALMFLLLFIAGAVAIHQHLNLKRSATVQPQVDTAETQSEQYQTRTEQAPPVRNYPTVVRLLGAQTQQSQRVNPIFISQTQTNSNFLQSDTPMYNANAFNRPVRYN